MTAAEFNKPQNFFRSRALFLMLSAGGTFGGMLSGQPLLTGAGLLGFLLKGTPQNIAGLTQKSGQGLASFAGSLAAKEVQKSGGSALGRASLSQLARILTTPPRE